MTDELNSPDKRPFTALTPETAARCDRPGDELPLPPFVAGPDADEEIDALYRQALDAMEAVELGAQRATETVVSEEGSTQPVQHDDTANREEDVRCGADVSSPSTLEDDPSNELNGETYDGERPSRLSPKQVIEAALFVGGAKLTAKKLRDLLRGNFAADFVERSIDDLNRQYAEQRRPYEILFGEGGYRSVLKSEFDSVRNRVFGLGPREIRLSQESLEVLSLVAYQQPITPETIDTIRGKGTASTLRQLLRRELIAIERDPEDRKHVDYRTTPRFLQLFGLGSLDELPQADDLNFK